MKHKKILPPLDHLVAFEAAAIHGGFAAASQALNLSETAISRKIRLLEGHYNTALFIRGHRSVTLTNEGSKLLNQVTNAMDILRDASRDALGQNHTTNINLAATNSVASLWLLPKLKQFKRYNPKVQITFIASDNDDECLQEDIDLTILRGDGNWPGFETHLLFGETIFPVCSPEYMDAHKDKISLKTISSLDLLEVCTPHTEWMNWSTWLDKKNAPTPLNKNIMQFNSYPLSIQAATNSLGIALGWGHLLDQLLQKGTLIHALPSEFIRTKSGYYLIKRPKKKITNEQKTLEKWLKHISDSRQRYSEKLAIQKNSIR